MANAALDDDPIDVGHSALIVSIPAAEPAVRGLRRTHDPNMRLGVPAHITVLSPWIPPASLGEVPGTRPRC